MQRRVRITTGHGAHARPVAELARLALGHSRPIILTTERGERVDLTSILAVMDLGLDEGETVLLETAPSATAGAVLDAMVDVLAPTQRPR